jgi:hypothetical protein
MEKIFRAWDGEQYWYADHQLLFTNGYAAKYLHEIGTPFELKDLDQYIGMTDCDGAKIYENDVICNEFDDPNKHYRVIWSFKECGFRKVPRNGDSPETKIDSAFITILGTIHSH